MSDAPLEVRKACLRLGLGTNGLTITTVIDAWKKQVFTAITKEEDAESVIILNAAKDCLIAWLENRSPERNIEKPSRTGRSRPLKAVAVGHGASGDSRADFHTGQNMICRILHADPDGYAVLVPKYNFVGVLVTEQRLTPDEEVSAQFVCRSNGRMLLQCRFGPKTTLPGET